MASRTKRLDARRDLSSKIDLTAIALVFPPTDERRAWRIGAYVLTPEATLDERAHRDRAPYREWVDAGFLRTCPGNRIDQDAVRDLVLDACDRFDVRSVGVDPYNAGNLVQLLETGDGLSVIEIAQSMLQMSGPAKDFEADVLDGLIDAGRNPLLAWCASNVVVMNDNKGNIYPVKKRSRGRIDPIVAALFARKLAALDVDTPPAEPPVLVVA
jgi:phage terminase large subunit-like protein